MQIVIPMSGKGERFRKVGYEEPKPLIEVNGKPIIAHIIDLFPSEKDLIFICDKEHLEKTSMREIIKKYCPYGKIVPIESHNLGPVYAVSKAFNFIKDNEPIIVNYADFSCYWNYKHFKNWLEKVNPDGCIPAYRGFHPHSLAGNNYAFMKVKNGWINEIKEKESFTNNKMEEYASSGTYYFSKGSLLKRFFNETISRKLLVNNEYYCSVVYNLMVDAALSVAVYELQHFMQWGTPEDLNEYLKWSKAFKALSCQVNQKNNFFKGTTLIPMAGKGSRFLKENYKIPKPLILVNQKPMVVQAAKCLPKSDKYHFVALKDTYLSKNLGNIISKEFNGVEFTLLGKEVNGQALSCLTALKKIPFNEPLTISSCDHGVIYNQKKLKELLENNKIDIIVWINRGHPHAIRDPYQYGWAKTKGQKIEKVSVKTPLDNPKSDPILIGTFTFKKASIFKNCVEKLIQRNDKVNEEFYVDSCINDAISIGYNCYIFEVDHYLCWGTPSDLKTFHYWQSCFHKWESHPYKWSKDILRFKSTSIGDDDIPGYLKEVNSEYPF